MPDIVEHCSTNAEAIEEFHNWMAFLSPIKCGNIEGNHRLEYTARTVRGYNIGSTVPLQREPTFKVLPGSSTVFGKVPTRIWCGPNRPFNSNVVSLYPDLSQEIQTDRTLAIDNSHQNILLTIADGIFQYTDGGTNEEKVIDMLAFITSVVEKRGSNVSDQNPKMEALHRTYLNMIVDACFSMNPIKTDMMMINLKKDDLLNLIGSKKSGWKGQTCNPYKRVSENQSMPENNTSYLA